MKKLAGVIVVWVMLFVGVSLWWKHYASPVSIAERITELDLPGNASPVAFHNDYSLLFSSGITCGEIAIRPEAMNDLLRQAREKQFRRTMTPRLSYRFFRQPGCCQDTSTRSAETPGWVRIVRADRFETNYVVIDSLRQRVYFFRSVHDLTH